MKERVAEVLKIFDCNYAAVASVAVIREMHEPDPKAVAIVADRLKIDGTKVAAIWMLLIEEMGK